LTHADCSSASHIVPPPRCHKTEKRIRTPKLPANQVNLVVD
jgi:hypothetical protein